MLLISLFGPSSASVAFHNTSTSTQATQEQLLHNVFVDSGCTKTLFRDASLLVNVCKLKRPSKVLSVGGLILTHHVGDYPLVLQQPNGECHFRLIKGCLLASGSSANLLATNKLTASGVAVKFPMDDDKGTRQQCTLTIHHREGHKIRFFLSQHHGLWPVPSRKHCQGLVEINGRDMNKLMHEPPCTNTFVARAFHTCMLTDAEL